MNWVARAKETFLGVAASHADAVELTAAAVTRWDSLQALRSAINETLTGSPDIHPAAQAFSQRAGIRRYLILVDTATEAEQLAAAIAPLAADAQATIFNLDHDRLQIDNLAASHAVDSERYDAVFVSLLGDAKRDFDALFTGLNAALSEAGLLWTNLRPAIGAERIASPHLTGLLDEMLQQVPSRWRLKERFKDMTAAPRALSGQAAANALRAHFEIISQQSRGGAMLERLFATGCIAAEMDEDAEGRELLQALYRVERDFVDSGEVSNADAIYLARPRHHRSGQVRMLFQKHAAPLPEGAIAGMSGPLPQWIKFNLTSALQSARAGDYAAPFPPPDLMYHTTGLDRDRDFAQHGADILSALSAASPRPMNSFAAVLDFGVGVGRVGRYFKGFSGRYVGVDIDAANIAWTGPNLPWIEAVQTQPASALPFEDASFDGVISISVFTHIDREMTGFYIDELHRVTRPGAILFLTLHGERALARALSEEAVGRLIGIPPERLEQAKASLAQDGFDFAEQYTHLTRDDYRYGTTFASQAGAEAIFGRRFRVHGFVSGAIHAFQDLIVLERP